ncbi:hypothetical protein AJ85_01330 [Alkalihalobacillus alcalophilus ATCC 27647 = CGMCC 1.3604]|uniref:Uncharacterized protein n=1 Tax=Alkalihalobacillus alcalophilus ATCC 27647 = CGMCC 1.3604 TaxID=1218173 RepID=A0A094XGH6_ALKAL|nr:hypothetical protein [Alkalihalobacillus alcalophilus]KGA97860.1 hypothetical protein BALCAV_0207420 [Alkalihalobacillus alcalophilus ATCC 27647 = CGMCC 1.3604]MED1562105.1 hypothetical protein [Alkalihalobacillus alcalophilus]THG88672.1 hypothetical protein AJ85_01330 [Alkalihalobacillus alcalophilus ATCC 27647 = CGMCC 1.3604]
MLVIMSIGVGLLIGFMILFLTRKLIIFQKPKVIIYFPSLLTASLSFLFILINLFFFQGFTETIYLLFFTTIFLVTIITWMYAKMTVEQYR